MSFVPPMHVTRPDPPDFRDRLYNPTLSLLPKFFNARPYADPAMYSRVKNQGLAAACTGYALAAMVEGLVYTEWKANREEPPEPGLISPFMLYYMACRYEGVPGMYPDGGSTARSAMKAWHKNGACHLNFWKEMVTDSADAGTDWIADAFQTPLGAYYRVDHGSVSDIQAALTETGFVYATAMIHTGWGQLDDTNTIPFAVGAPSLGGHAFVLVGYDEDGFWLQNSWGDDWGKRGFARLSYADWRANAMDAWIGQLGVHISSQAETMDHGLQFANVKTAQALQADPGRALLSSDPNLSAQQINPYVIDIENNGLLSDTGQFHTTPGDLRLLLSHYLPIATQQWGLTETDPIDVALYAHGGLDDEAAAEDIAKRWIPDLFASKIFPVFFMWETGIVETLEDKIIDQMRGAPALAGASFWDQARQRLEDWWDDRFESTVIGIGTPFWEEIKKNAELASENPNGGLSLLYTELMRPEYDAVRSRLRLHLIGHSAGSIFHSFLLPKLLTASITVSSITFMAPACRVELFESNVLPAYESGQVKVYTQFHLKDTVEYTDTCKPLPYYRSLLYLLSNACERQRARPLLGMEKFVVNTLEPTKPAGAQIWDWIATPTALRPTDPGYDPKSSSGSKAHGDFSSDAPTRSSVIQRILATP